MAENAVAELEQLRRENAELRAALARCSGTVAAMRWLLREAGVEEPMTTTGEPLWCGDDGLKHPVSLDTSAHAALRAERPAADLRNLLCSLLRILYTFG